MGERKEMKAAQDDLAALKQRPRNIQKINQDAGRLSAANAAFGALAAGEHSAACALRKCNVKTEELK